MPEVFNIYCDESCHLQNDHQKVMVLGAVWSPKARVPELARASRKLKEDFGLSPQFELKWGKVSRAKLDYYTAILDWFWNSSDVHFRALIVPDKTKLNHTTFKQTHDEWYYKRYFDLLKVIIDPQQQYEIYLDIKETRGASKVAKLHGVLCNAQYDFARSIIQKIQLVRSHEVELLQLADFLIGLLSYANRGLVESEAKVSLVQRLRAFTHYSLSHSTLLKENKVNLFRWHAREQVGAPHYPTGCRN
jgi:uncharacterized protein DUF3800